MDQARPNPASDLWRAHNLENYLELELRRRSGTAFQDFFARLMSRAHGSDYVAVRSFGRLGDQGCDGYLRSSGEVFACYGAQNGEQGKVSSIVAKIRDDFDKARKNLTDIMRAWTMVHNLIEGLPIEAVKAIETLASQHPDLKFDIFDRDRFAAVMKSLDDGGVASLLGPIAGLSGFHGGPGAAFVDSTGTTHPTHVAGRHDAEARELTDLIDALILAYEFEKAIAKAKELEHFIYESAAATSPFVASNAYATLIQSELLRVARGVVAPADGAAAARHWLQMAWRTNCTTDRFNALEAAIMGLEGQHEEALRRLSAATDPEAVLRRVGLLRDQNRVQDAAALVADLEPHPRWCHQGILVLLRAGNFKKATELRDWSLTQDGSTMRRCHLVYAVECVQGATQPGQEGGNDAGA